MSFAIDVSNVEIEDGFTSKVYPKSMYLVNITSADTITTANGSEAILLKMEMIDGAYKGDTYVECLNVQHPNNIPREIGLKLLKKMMIATGIPLDKPFTDPSVLVGNMVTLDVGISKKGENTIYGVNPASQSSPAAIPAEHTNMANGQQPNWG